MSGIAAFVVADRSVSNGLLTEHCKRNRLGGLGCTRGFLESSTQVLRAMMHGRFMGPGCYPSRIASGEPRGVVKLQKIGVSGLVSQLLNDAHA